MNPASGKPVVTCPSCGRDVVYDVQSPCRPFCSERCRLIDFGGWASEKYRVPAQSPPDDLRDDEA